jgi:hypothetical protein
VEQHLLHRLGCEHADDCLRTLPGRLAQGRGGKRGR